MDCRKHLKEIHTVHTALKACLKYRVKHRQPYRTRLKMPVLLHRDALCSQIEKLLHELSGVTGVEVHARTGSVILEHPGGLVEIAAVLEIIDEALARSVPPGNCSPVLPTKSTKCKLSVTDRSLKNMDKKIMCPAQSWWPPGCICCICG